MTLEERAEEYAKAHNWIIPDIQEPTAKQAYIAGYKSYEEYARNHAFTEMKQQGLFPFGQWYFVKDGDLPDTSRDVLSDKYDIVHYDTDNRCWVDTRLDIEIDSIFHNVIAWCELPLAPIEEVL